MANYHISKKAGQVKEIKKSLLNLGGIAKGRKVGFDKERDFAKKAVSKKIAQEGL